jgi:hypothetical protein
MYKSAIQTNAILFVLTSLSYLGILYGCLYFVGDFRLAQLPAEWWVAFTVAYGILLYCYCGVTSNTIEVSSTFIKVYNVVPGFRKNLTFKFSAVNAVHFKQTSADDLTQSIKPRYLAIPVNFIAVLLLPAEWKYIRIVTDKAHLFYCSGIESDYYEYDGNLSFEHLHKQCEQAGLNTMWIK